MRQFYILFSGHNPNTIKRLDLLKKAAALFGIPVVEVDTLNGDISEIGPLNCGDMLFNCARGGLRLEMKITHGGVATFHERLDADITYGYDSTMFIGIHERFNLPGPKTILQCPHDRDLLEKYVEWLGDFPIIVKASGGAKGIGTLIVRGMDALLSFAEYAEDLEDDFILREYIEHEEVLRVMVLGNEVIGTVRKPKREGDFRSGTGLLGELDDPIPENIRDLAVAATLATKYEFTGVDIIDHPERGPLLIEVNGPCDFVPIFEERGVNLAENLVAYLMAKSDRLMADGDIPNE